MHLRHAFLALALSLLAGPALAQLTQAQSAGSATELRDANGARIGVPGNPLAVQGTGTQTPTRPTLISGNVALSTTATTVIQANTTMVRWGYQVQGTGYACLSWGTATPTITGVDNTAKCGGAGSFLVGTGSAGYSSPIAIQSGVALTAVAAAGASLQIVYEVQ